MARIKIIDYKGKVVGNWAVPKTKKQFTWCIVRLVRFYYRCKKNNLLTNDIILVLKSFVESETIKPYLATTIISHPEVLQGIQEIRKLEPHELQEEVVSEKIRKHARALCSICNVSLKYPAFVVYRKKNGQVVGMSSAIGIHCLNQTVGKLRDLVTKIEISHEKTEQIKNVSRRKLYTQTSNKSKTSPYLQLVINF